MKQLRIGTIVNTHGLKGELKIKGKTHFSEERFAAGKTVFLKEQDAWQPLVIDRVRTQRDMLLVTFQGLYDINQVEKWKGCDLYVDADTLQELPGDEIYYHELYDCSVYDEKGNCHGTVTEVIETGANAVLRIQNEKTSFLLPYVKAFVIDVDKVQKRILIKLMEGLL